MSFSSPSADFVLLATTNASASSSVSFDGYFSATYKNYFIIGSMIQPADSGARYFRARFRRSNADVTASSYFWVYQQAFAQQDGNVYSGENGAYNTSHISLGGEQVNTQTKNFNLYLYNPLDTSYKKTLTYDIQCWFESGYIRFFKQNGAGVLQDNNNALSGISFYYDSGNITTGNFKLYGIK